MEQALHKIHHKKPGKPQDAPVKAILIQYGAKVQKTETGTVRIFGDPQIVPKIVSGVIYPWSTSVLMEPCESRILASGSYCKLQQLRSSSAFQVYPAIGQFAVDNETAATKTTTMITGADSAAFDGVTISKRARAAVGARADFNMWKLFGQFVIGWRSLFSLSFHL